MSPAFAGVSLPAPTISTLIETTLNGTVGDKAGGYAGKVTGAGFSLGGLTAVKVDGVACTSLSILDDNNATFVIPAGATNGLKDCQVVGPGGTNTLSNGFRYWDPGAVTCSLWLRGIRWRAKGST